ncbi:hypothetical protein [Myxococcus sp. Y35]|uniref:hypothetical protein n=1 Tax=Pseudomyxococcus flavus TaxID=3115648 RepID=UPI003CE6978A
MTPPGLVPPEAVTGPNDVPSSSPLFARGGHNACQRARRDDLLAATRGDAVEATSIQALVRLRDALDLHGADASLVSALDELMHTGGSTRQTWRHGAAPGLPKVEPLPPRSLFAVALDNAVEGCVRETFGALVSRHQALHARDGGVRAFMARVAEDETRHAELFWKVDHWAQARLSAGERDVLRLAKQRASEALRAEVAEPVSPVFVSEAGLPPPEVAVALVDTLARELWA